MLRGLLLGESAAVWIEIGATDGCVAPRHRTPFRVSPASSMIGGAKTDG